MGKRKGEDEEGTDVGKEEGVKEGGGKKGNERRREGEKD